MSPMCSIMEAMAMGAMTRMAEISNLATEPPKLVTKGWKPSTSAPARLVKSTLPATRATM